jgi:hypothetical protein
MTRGGIVVQDAHLTKAIPRDNVDLMQFSGLQDMSGREIYEGDVLVSHLDQSKFTVMLENGAFRLEPERRDGNHVLDEGIINQQNLHVAGNIYESPSQLTPN